MNPRAAARFARTFRYVALLVFLAWTAVSPIRLAAQTPPDDRNLFWTYLPETEARKGLPVEFEGIVLCYDFDWGQLYVDDGQNAIYLPARVFTNQFEVGQRVKIHGRTAWNDTHSSLTNGTAIIEGHQSLPQARPVRMADLADSSNQWVEIHGRVRTAENSRGRIGLMVSDGETECLVYVMKTTTTDDFKSLNDAEVSIKGINISQVSGGKLDSARLFCPGLSEMNVVQHASESRWQQPVTPICTLMTRPLGAWTNQPVHINGLVSDYQPGQSMIVKDASGSLCAELIQVAPVSLYERVDLWGFLCVRSNQTVLADSYFQITRAFTGKDRLNASHKAGTSTNLVLTAIRPIRELSRELADENLPVKIQGILTFVDTDWGLAFLQDQHDAIFFNAKQKDLRSGQYVEVTGQTEAGGFAPDLINCRVKVLGTASLPAPLKVDLQDVAGGQLDSRWVEMKGVVQHITRDNGRLILNLTGHEGKFNAIVLDPDNTADTPEQLVDALVSIQGACGSSVNSLGQISGTTLHVPDRSQITIIDPRPANPFAITATPISTVATYSPLRVAGRRVKVSGVVTLMTPDHDLFLQDHSGGIRVANVGANDFQIGERLDVLGFPTLRDFSPCLEGALVQRQGTNPLPAARKTSAEQILSSGGYDGTRVELQAQVIQSYFGSAQTRLLLQDGSIIFSAQFVSSARQNNPALLDAGSIVRLQGICAIQGNENNEPSSFRLLLASPRDVTVLKTASWWTAAHAILVLGGTSLVAALASLWVFLLRRQVRTQTGIIRQNQGELLAASRLAGMAEIATNVLHNVGNVLNSVNISATVVSNKIKSSTVLKGLSDVSRLIEEHQHDLGDFVARDPRGKHLPAFLKQLADRYRVENETKVQELATLGKHLDHIKDIIARQLNLAKVGSQLETVVPRQMIEDALLINAGDFSQHGIDVKREYTCTVEEITIDKHKLLEILVNLISNAKNACAESDRQPKQITLRLEQTNGHLRMSVQDNGVGIAPENLGRIFRHGFTTRKNGHGFGLHSGALAAKQMGGQLSVRSDGPGHGACFTLEIPTTPVLIKAS